MKKVTKEIDGGENYTFHDNKLHGINFISSADVVDLSLDIDFISKWPASSHKDFFEITPALLIFHDLTDLNIRILWPSSNFRITRDGGYIDEIVKKKVEKKYLKSDYFEWLITLDNGGQISFGASGFSLRKNGEAVLSGKQFLNTNERILFSPLLR